MNTLNFRKFINHGWTRIDTDKSSILKEIYVKILGESVAKKNLLLVLIRVYSWLIVFLVAPAYSDEMQMKADSASYKKEEGVLYLEGNAYLIKGSITLKAPLVKLTGEMNNPKVLTASGGVSVLDKGRNARIKAKKIEAFLKEKKASAEKDVEVEYSTRKIWADSAKYDGEKNIVTFTGNCKAVDSTGTFTASSILYFMNEDRIQFKGDVSAVIIFSD
jgi:lipopolysaccharide export system protein LptA